MSNVKWMQPSSFDIDHLTFDIQNMPQQLEMSRPHLEELPTLAIPGGSGLRTFVPGDEEHWVRIMNDCIGSAWTVERCRAELVERPEFRADGCFFALVEGIPQGTATAWVKPELVGETGYVHMVGAAPSYRGRGLGLLVTLAALHWFRAHGFRRAVLHTDDWRLPAIGVYRRLGFEPVLIDDEHARRWAEVEEKLGQRRTSQ
jgi:mycothiol synthase